MRSVLLMLLLSSPLALGCQSSTGKGQPTGQADGATNPDSSATGDSSSPLDTTTPDDDAASPGEDVAGEDAATPPDTNVEPPDDNVLLEAQAATEEGVGLTAQLTFELPETAGSFVITLEGDTGVTYAVDALRSPTGQSLVLDNWYDSPLNGGTTQLCLVCVNRITPMEGASGTLVPNTTEVKAPPGTYTFRVFAFRLESNGFFEPPTVVPAGGVVNIRVTAQPKVDGQLPSQGVLNLNLHFTGSNGLTAESAPTDDRLQTALQKVKDAYAAAGITIGEITYRDIDAAWQVVDGFSGANNDFEEAAMLTAGNPRGVNVIFVRELSDSGNPLSGFGVVLGIAGGVPGPAGAQGTRRSAVFINTQDTQNAPPSNTDTLGITIAHEVGHYLGLYHASELDIGFGQPQIHDPIPDSPENDPTNLMYYNNTDAIISPGQAFVLRNNPWVQPTQ